MVAIGYGGTDISVAEADSHVWGYAVGIDMTRRDLQGEAKKAGRPWDMAKGFDLSAPIGPLVPATATGPLSRGAIELKVDGKVRQSSDLDRMIWSVPETIAYLSGLVRLMPGDLIFTGTPEGVGAVGRGQRMEARIAGLPGLDVEVV